MEYLSIINDILCITNLKKISTCIVFGITVQYEHHDKKMSFPYYFVQKFN